MSSNVIITISRQYGSGGRNIGKKLAKLLDLPYYDKQLIYEAAKESGINADIAKDLEERPTNSLLYSYAPTSFFAASPYTTNIELPLTDLLFLAQSDTIKRFADQGSCIIVGRCANYVLRDNSDVVDVFIHRDFSERINQIAKIEGLTAKQARDLVKKTDKHRANYYNHYTDFKWGDINDYDLCLDSGTLGEDGCADVIACFIEKAKVRRKTRG